MNWNSIKKQIYFEDGSLRDIIVPDWSVDNWRKWTELINAKYKVEFSNGQTETISDKINFEVVKAYWEGKSDIINTATIYIDQVIIKCYFFDDKEFENDIQPKEFVAMKDHLNLVDYMIAISSLNKKTVLLTNENLGNSVLIEVSGQDVKYCA